MTTVTSPAVPNAGTGSVSPRVDRGPPQTWPDVPPLEAERRLGAATYTHGVDAAPLLAQIAHHLQRLHFDVVLIGNAAAALQGAPVTTVDFDFMFRKTPVSLRKLKALAKALGATVLRPYYPASDLFRVVRDDDGLQLDFMADVHGVRSLAGLRARATPVDLGGSTLLVASLADIIKSKRAARRPRDLAVLDVLERTHDEKKRAAEDARRPPARKRPRAR